MVSLVDIARLATHETYELLREYPTMRPTGAHARLGWLRHFQHSHFASAHGEEAQTVRPYEFLTETEI